MIPFQWSLHRLEPDGEAQPSRVPRVGQGEPAARLRREPDRGSRGGRRSGGGLHPLRANPDRRAGARVPGPRGRSGRHQPRASSTSTSWLAHTSTTRTSAAPSPSRGWRPPSPRALAMADLDEVAEGAAAAAAFLRVARGELEPSEEQRLREALIAYCKRDTPRAGGSAPGAPRARESGLSRHRGDAPRAARGTLPASTGCS